MGDAPKSDFPETEEPSDYAARLLSLATEIEEQRQTIMRLLPTVDPFDKDEKAFVGHFATILEAISNAAFAVERAIECGFPDVWPKGANWLHRLRSAQVHRSQLMILWFHDMAPEGFNNQIPGLAGIKRFVQAMAQACNVASDRLRAEADSHAAHTIEERRQELLDAIRRVIAPQNNANGRTEVQELADLVVSRLSEQSSGMKMASPNVSCSADFRSVSWFGVQHSFTANEAACVSLLMDSWRKGAAGSWRENAVQKRPSALPNVSTMCFVATPRGAR